MGQFYPNWITWCCQSASDKPKVTLMLCGADLAEGRLRRSSGAERGTTCREHCKLDRTLSRSRRWAWSMASSWPWQSESRARAILTLDLHDFGAVTLKGEPEIWPRDL